LTYVTASSYSTVMTVLTTTSVAATYNNNTSSGLGGTRVSKDLRYFFNSTNAATT
jgi:hypothetical protein